MKTSVSSYSYLKYMRSTGADLFKICDLAKKTGFDGIEFTRLNEDGRSFDETRKLASELKSHCDEIGLPIVAYAVGANFLCQDPSAEAEKIKRDADIAASLSAPVMRHDVCYSLPKKHLYSYRDAAKDMAPYIRDVADYAMKIGVKTCTENHGYIFQSPERVELLMLTVNHPSYGWLCDIGNFLCADADPVKAVTVAKDYVFHAHVKDFLFKDGSVARPSGFFGTSGGNHIRGTILGHGTVPVRNCLSILKNSGYDGYVSLEFEGPEDNLEAISASYGFLKKTLSEI